MRAVMFAVTFAVLCGSAIADSSSWTAMPVQPSSVGQFVGNSVAWTCGDSGCSSVSNTSGAVAMAECRALARRVGHLSSFVTGKGPFTDGRLAECNQAAPTP
jgi:hypothetical protein